jgi:hypothetical protein
VCGDFPKPSQPDGSIAPCRPTRSPATGSVGMADVIASAREGGEQLQAMSGESGVDFRRLVLLSHKIRHRVFV